LKVGSVQTIRTGNQTFEVEVVARGSWKAEDFDHFEFVSDYEVNGLTNHYHTFGLGVPLIAVRKPHDGSDATEKYYPPGLSFPVTAFLRVCPSEDVPAEGRPNQQRCVLEFYDPLMSSEIVMAGRRVPLETDLSTSLAYMLSQPALKETDIATIGLLSPAASQTLQGLYMLEPYNPRKIPVLMVHGLWSSPMTWMELFNDLRSLPEIRNNYQFWFYLYPTGQPFWISASGMREDLAGARGILDPNGHAAALDQMVLVGHSMGGLVSRLQTLDSGDDYWHLISDKSPDQLNATPEDRARLMGLVFFKPNRSIRRVVTIATPHRGSDFANDTTRWLARKVIDLPERLVSSKQRLVVDNPGLFRDTELLTINTSIDSLSPTSPVLRVMLNSPSPPWVKYHNVVGLVPDSGIMGRVAEGTDGVVAMTSAHLDDVESEIVVQADHVNVHRHPRSVLEVRRILLEHLEQVRHEYLTGTDPRTLAQPATYYQLQHCQ